MRVYRIETVSGDGPYNGAAKAHVQYSEAWQDMFDEWRCPAPYFDLPGWSDMCGATKAPYRFGFKSREQLAQWFTRETRETLRNIGFWLASYDVPDGHTLQSQRQVAFNSEHATLVNRVSL